VKYEGVVGEQHANLADMSWARQVSGSLPAWVREGRRRSVERL